MSEPTVRRFPALFAAVALAGLLASSALAKGFAETPPAEAPTSPGPPPVVSHYTPLPASWDAPITVHGTNLLPKAPPQLALHEDAPKTYLFWGNHKKFGMVPESAIQSWTDTAIQIDGLKAPQGVYGIVLIRGGEIISNFNKTLLIEDGPPKSDGPRVLVGESGGGGVGKVVPIPIGGLEDIPTDVAEDFFLPDDTLLQKGPGGPYADLVPPQQLGASVTGYQPAIAGADDEIVVTGFFPSAQNHRLVYGVLDDGARSLQPDEIKSWSPYQIVIHAGAIPMGVWWIAVFEVDFQAQHIALVSNLNLGLQVVENPPPGDPNALTVDRSGGSGQQGGAPNQMQQMRRERAQPGLGRSTTEVAPRVTPKVRHIERTDGGAAAGEAAPVSPDASPRKPRVRPEAAPVQEAPAVAPAPSSAAPAPALERKVLERAR